MKKRRLFTLALLGAAVIFTTSCSDDEEDEPIGPALTVTEAGGSNGGAMTITQGESLVFAWDTRKGETNLKTFNIEITGANTPGSTTTLVTADNVELPYSNSGSHKTAYVDGITFPDAGVALGATKYTFISTDGIGKSKSIAFTVSVEASSTTTNLSVASPFTWSRAAGANGVGLAEFGLAWELNSGGYAIVKTQESTTMVKLPASSWTAFVTQEDLSSAITSGTSISQYNDVSTNAGATYNDVLGVRYNGQNFLIHITNSTVVTDASGTTMTITGMFKD